MTVSTYAEPKPFGASGNLPDWVGLLAPVAELAEQLARTEFVPKSMRGRPEAVAAAILYGAELGIGPMQALQSIDVVEGSPAPNAELMRALVLRAGHEIYPTEATGQRVTMNGKRRGQSNTTAVTWTIEMARSAGLAGKDVWKRYPRAMLTNRATTELCRVLFPDIVAGLSHTADELEADGTPVPTPEPGTPKRRMRREPLPELPAVDVETGEISPGSPQAVEDEPPGRPETALEPPLTADPPAPDMSAPGPSENAVKAMHAATTEALDNPTREQRLAFTSAALGRHVDSSRGLSANDVSVVLDVLEQLQGGHLRLEWSTDSAGMPVARFDVPVWS